MMASASMPDFLLISTMVALPIMIFPTGELSILNFGFTCAISAFSQGYWAMRSANLVSLVISIIVAFLERTHAMRPYINLISGFFSVNFSFSTSMISARPVPFFSICLMVL